MALTYVTDIRLLDYLLSETEQALLSNDEAYGDSTRSDVIEKYIEWAEGTIDSYVGSQFGLPLATPYPTALIHAVLVIAKYRLMLRRNYMTDAIEAEYTDVMAWLRMVRDGEIDLYPIDPDADGSTAIVGFVDLSQLVFADGLPNAAYQTTYSDDTFD